jgi:hypothetical protein
MWARFLNLCEQRAHSTLRVRTDCGSELSDYALTPTAAIILPVTPFSLR